MKFVCSNDKGDLVPNMWVFSVAHLPLGVVVHCSKQLISMQVCLDNSPCTLSFVYAATNYIDRWVLWEALISFAASCDDPWMVVGDFNAILGAHERAGGNHPSIVSCSNFPNMIDVCSLTHLLIEENLFTWCNNSNRGRIEQRLDKALCNLAFYDAWPNNKSLILPRSDHSALVVSGFPINSLGLQPFRFHSVWIEHHDFEKVVKDAWLSVDFSDPTRSMLSKLRALKTALRSWNVAVFGNIHARVDNVRANLSAIQCSISSGNNSEQLYNDEVAAKLELLQAVCNQSIFLKEKARVRWLTDGDWCTKFFHAYCRMKMARSSINSLLIDGVLNTNLVEISNHLVSYYVKLYSATPSVEDPTTVCLVIPHLVSKADNAFLTEVPSTSEIKDLVFAIVRMVFPVFSFSTIGILLLLMLFALFSIFSPLVSFLNILTLILLC